MKKIIFSIAVAAIAVPMQAQEMSPANDAWWVADTTLTRTIEAVEVIGSRAVEQTPVAHTNLSKEEIATANFGQDIPFLLTATPSVVATSDAGTGIGYTGIRIRGTDETRINVTSNGVPLNDPESHRLYWVNVPDLVSSTQSIQIQRGVGTSTNGSGAFGGSINLLTEPPAANAGGEITISGGSFGTLREMVKVNTGLMGGRWAMTLRGSNIASDGYIERASASLQSYFAQLGYYGDRTIMKWIAFGGQERTYHAWDGISAKQMKKNRRYNPCGEMFDADGETLLGYYPDQTDIYRQFNYQFIVNHAFAKNLNANLTLHYTDGAGYYEEYKNGVALEEYALQPVPNDESNIVRRKQMSNDFAGFVASLNYNSEKLTASVGAAFNDYIGTHWGDVIWVRDYVGLTPNHKYYDNDTDKWEANVYGRAQWQLADWVSLYGDVQYRRISHYIAGVNDVWDGAAMQPLNVNRQYDFLNPKAGVTFTISPNSTAYVSVATAHKEPDRNAFTNARPGDPTPLPEQLIDYEAGYKLSIGKRFAASVNLYYMDYKDQLILTGKINDIGEAISANVPESYRAGVELTAGVEIITGLRLDANATFSRNRISDYTEYVDDWDNGGQIVNYLGDTPIAYSPEIIAGGMLSYTFKGFMIGVQSQYVGSQYVTNSAQGDLKLPSYFVTNLRARYDAGKFVVGVELNNIFNAMYCSNAWGYSYYYEGERKSDMGYYPQAGFNVLASVSIKF